MMFRYLRADEVECRVSQCTEKGAALLLYKDARCDMAILDETVGPMNWQRHHSRDNANCIVSIYFKELDAWIEKEDTGSESNTEAAKGLCSDSFKRACVNWGIGRELYTAPFIWVGADDCNVYQDKGKWKCKDRFVVSKMEVANGKITDLEITNNGNVVYWMKSKTPKPKQIICERCNETLTDIKDKNGATLTPEQLKKMSMVRFGGKVYCPNCQRELVNAAKAKKEENNA